MVAAGAPRGVNVVSSGGMSPLYLATALGHEDAAKRLVLAGADVNGLDPDDGRCFLMKAVEGGCGYLIEYLLLSGVSPNTLDILLPDRPNTLDILLPDR